MSKFIGDPAFRGTLERRLALVIDHYVAYGKAQGTTGLFFLTGSAQSWDDVVVELAHAVRKMHEEQQLIDSDEKIS